VARRGPSAFLSSKRRADLRKCVHDTQRNVLVATLYTLLGRYSTCVFTCCFTFHLSETRKSLLKTSAMNTHTQNLAQVVTFLNFNTELQGLSYSWYANSKIKHQITALSLFLNIVCNFIFTVNITWGHVVWATQERR